MKSEGPKNKIKEFFATSWAIDNKTSVYVLIVFIVLIGMVSYSTIPKEQFPEIVIPTILVSTPYPGTSPTDMENLVTRPIEKQIKSLAGVKKITSNSLQDFSSIVVEFNTDVLPADAKQKVKDAVDKARSDLPNNLPTEPNVRDIDFSEIPIMYINISGQYDLNKLKKYADRLQDKIEGLKEITRVDIVGALDREIQINVDMYKMQAASVSFRDIESAVAYENMTVSGGSIPIGTMRRSLRVVGQFADPEIIKNIVIKSGSGALVYLKDIAEIKDGFKEQESFSRFNGLNVINLSVIKKSGQNLIDASDNIKKILAEEKLVKAYPPDMKVNLSGDSSKFTRNTLEELNNTIIIGFLLVILVLMFFMGFTNAFFVGLSVPLSMCVAYMIMPGLGFTMNMIVMFGFIFALGIIVDDAIVVIENTHRIHRKEPNIILAAKHAAGEVFLPILSGTLTTLAPFLPLAFWPGIVGKFLHYMPVTLIVTLFASLFVAYIINPVFAVSFMKHEYDDKIEKPKTKFIRNFGIITLVIAILAFVAGYKGISSFAVFIFLLYLLFQFVIKKLIKRFQENWWPYAMSLYEKTLRVCLRGKNAFKILVGIIVLFFITIFITVMTNPKVVFFPDNMPNSIDVFIKMPVGTDQFITDSVTRIVENRISNALGKNNPIVESIISKVALGAGESMFDNTASSNRGKVTINFVEYKYRNGQNTIPYLDRIRKAIKGIPGAEIIVVKNKMGPPTGKPINIEITSDNLDELIADANSFKRYLDSIQIPGVEELKSDFQSNKPEIIIDVDRVRANREGISTAQVGSEVRTSVFGKEVSKYKDGEDEFPIMLRYNEVQRNNINTLLNMKITYRDMNNGMLRQIPLSAIANIHYSDSYGGIKRQNLKRIITISSEVLSGYTANEIVPKIRQYAKTFPKHDGVEIKLTGEREDQADAASFLGKAMMIALGLIFFILISQFNSMSKSLIILSEVIFSIIGVLLGTAIFHMTISVIMTGLGIVALGGIVVRNGILIVEFTDVLKAKGLKTRNAIVEAGRTRITPVVLTATATMLGLVPLAVGMNINFITMFTELNPHLHFGGDNVMFWGPLSWTIIFGLSFATFLTLVFVPAMYYLSYIMKIKMSRRKSNRLAKASRQIIH